MSTTSHGTQSESRVSVPGAKVDPPERKAPPMPTNATRALDSPEAMATLGGPTLSKPRGLLAQAIIRFARFSMAFQR